MVKAFGKSPGTRFEHPWHGVSHWNFVLFSGPFRRTKRQLEAKPPAAGEYRKWGANSVFRHGRKLLESMPRKLIYNYVTEHNDFQKRGKNFQIKSPPISKSGIFFARVLFQLAWYCRLSERFVGPGLWPAVGLPFGKILDILRLLAVSCTPEIQEKYPKHPQTAIFQKHISFSTPSTGIPDQFSFEIFTQFGSELYNSP